MGGGSGPGEPLPLLVFRRLRIDVDVCEVWKDGEPVELTAIEFDLLHASARHRGSVRAGNRSLSRSGATTTTATSGWWTSTLAGSARKSKMIPTRRLALIVTVRGAGYRFEDTPQ